MFEFYLFKLFFLYYKILEGENSVGIQYRGEISELNNGSGTPLAFCWRVYQMILYLKNALIKDLLTFESITYYIKRLCEFKMIYCLFNAA